MFTRAIRKIGYGAKSVIVIIAYLSLPFKSYGLIYVGAVDVFGGKVAIPVILGNDIVSVIDVTCDFLLDMFRRCGFLCGAGTASCSQNQTLSCLAARHLPDWLGKRLLIL